MQVDVVRLWKVGLIVLLGWASCLQAEQLDHNNQQDVLNFLQDYQPEAVSADSKMAFPELLQELEAKRAVFVGEQHDRYDHHLNQLAIIKALYEQNPKLAIGVEWFQQPFQQVLDDYLSGKIDEADLLRQSEYYTRWRYDFRLLRPVLEFARANKLPVIALNAQVEITSKVSKAGLDSLTDEERVQIPATIHPPGNTYRAYLKQVFDKHMGGNGDFERFVTIQRIWDETMAQNVVRYLEANPEHSMVVLAGSVHAGRDAIPGDVARSLPKEQLATVFSVAPENVEPGKYDYYLLTEELTLPPKGKLGVWLDDLDDGVGIKLLSEESAAGKAGLQKGDRFLELDGQAVNSMADLLIMLADRKPGEKVKVKAQRGDRVLEFEFSLQ